MRKLITLSLIFIFQIAICQELKCDVKVNSDRITITNKQIFNTLESSLTEFMNNTKWTNIKVNNNEKIECSLFLNLSSYSGDQFVGTLQIQASRPIFNSTFSSPIFSFNDNDLAFKYAEFENLFFNPNSFDSNIVSILGYYAYVILAMDADTFAPLGGTPFFTMAQTVMNSAQQSNFKGWKQADGNQSRFTFLSDILTPTFNPVRLAMYEYHSNGLDKMADNTKKAKENIINAIESLSKIHSVRPNAFVTRVFFDTKSDEITNIFSGGPSVSIAELVDNLNRISPTNAGKWMKIKM
uniref:type IX secretion system protein PorD n=1 Tax=Flavobacterium sp. TaxID=239 RepID=UPI0040496113